MPHIVVLNSGSHRICWSMWKGIRWHQKACALLFSRLYYHLYSAHQCTVHKRSELQSHYCMQQWLVPLTNAISWYSTNHWIKLLICIKSLQSLRPALTLHSQYQKRVCFFCLVLFRFVLFVTNSGFSAFIASPHYTHAQEKPFFAEIQ